MVKYFVEESDVHYAGSCELPPSQICRAQILTLKCVINSSLSLVIGRVFYREFRTSGIHMGTMCIPYSIVTLVDLYILLH